MNNSLFKNSLYFSLIMLSSTVLADTPNDAKKSAVKVTTEVSAAGTKQESVAVETDVLVEAKKNSPEGLSVIAQPAKKNTSFSRAKLLFLSGATLSAAATGFLLRAAWRDFDNAFGSGRVLQPGTGARILNTTSGCMLTGLAYCAANAAILCGLAYWSWDVQKKITETVLEKVMAQIKKEQDTKAQEEKTASAA